MPLAKRFSDQQITSILSQTLVYQCACPAQVCRTILGLRELYAYQAACLDRTDVDRSVHQSIAHSTSDAHARMELCLGVVLSIEGWDLDTLEMPGELRERQEQVV